MHIGLEYENYRVWIGIKLKFQVQLFSFERETKKKREREREKEIELYIYIQWNSGSWFYDSCKSLAIGVFDCYVVVMWRYSYTSSAEEWHLESIPSLGNKNWNLFFEPDKLSTVLSQLCYHTRAQHSLCSKNQWMCVYRKHLAPQITAC